MKTKTKKLKSKSKPKDNNPLHIQLSTLLDRFGNSVLTTPRDYGLNPIRITHKVSAKAREENQRLDTSIKARIARLGGSLNGQKLYLDSKGDPTTKKPTPAKSKHKFDLTKRRQLREEKTKPKSKIKTGRGTTILGHPATSVIRWMGKNNWKKSDVEKAVKALADGPVAALTIPTAWNHGRKGVRSIPKLTKIQIQQLKKAGGK